MAPCYAFYGWDFIVTFPREYKTMWKAQRWTPVRAAFFFNRYWGLLRFTLFICLAWLKVDPKIFGGIAVFFPSSCLPQGYGQYGPVDDGSLGSLVYLQQPVLHLRSGHWFRTTHCVCMLFNSEERG
ncbi:hypothetical protein BT69DRAFT_1132721 [Atractiella rhizophila]|nr:hypothetical protein BT69DRAFT_1132721 [Atractiella rhizophila]